MTALAEVLGRRPEGPCERCVTRPATLYWTGHASTLDLAHGAPVLKWCEVCSVEEQVAEAEKQAARIPKLRARLAELTGQAEPQDAPDLPRWMRRS